MNSKTLSSVLMLPRNLKGRVLMLPSNLKGTVLMLPSNLKGLFFLFFFTLQKAEQINKCQAGEGWVNYCKDYKHKEVDMNKKNKAINRCFFFLDKPVITRIITYI